MSVDVQLAPEIARLHGLSLNINFQDYSNEKCLRIQKEALNQNENINKFYQQRNKISSKFIDITSFLNAFQNSVKLDCRLNSEFECSSIRDSAHITCRDNITKKRLMTVNKLGVKDLISCPEIKKRLAEQDVEMPENKLLIILYDNETKDENDLMLNKNPLQIVLDNIKRTLRNVECKILEGGFQKFSKLHPKFCVQKERKTVIYSTKYEDSEDNLKREMENAKMNKILDYLYLGNESDAKNEDLLLKEGITHIINVTKNIPFYHENSDRIKIEYLRIPVNDSIDQDIKKYFDETKKFIDKVKQQNGKVLVHCQAGISRSSTIVIAYLMNMNNITLMEAYNTVKKIRTIVEPNFLFYSQLYEYESRKVCTDKMEEN